jgi:hypothetical protein
MPEEKHRPRVKIVDLDELMEQMQPTVDAVREMSKKLPEPNDFLLYPVMMASMLYEMSDGDYEIARENYREISDLVIFAYGVMRAEARAKAAAESKSNEPPPREGMH